MLRTERERGAYAPTLTPALQKRGGSLRYGAEKLVPPAACLPQATPKRPHSATLRAAALSVRSIARPSPRLTPGPFRVAFGYRLTPPPFGVACASLRQPGGTHSLTGEKATTAPATRRKTKGWLTPKHGVEDAAYKEGSAWPLTPTPPANKSAPGGAPYPATASAAQEDTANLSFH